ncbi:Cna B domain-containing protein, partial [Roseivivax marinus]
SFIGNTLSGDNLLMGLESEGDTVSGNTFTGTPGYTALELWGAGSTVAENAFDLAVGDAEGESVSLTAFVDGAGAYDEAQIAAGNTAPEGAAYAVITGDTLVYADDAEAAAAAAGADGAAIELATGNLAVFNGMSIQAAIDAASEGATIDIFPGDYNEGADGARATILNGGEVSLAISTAGLTLRGVDAEGTPITDSAATEATLSLEYQSNWGSYAFVEADGVTIQGLTITTPGVDYGPDYGAGVNKLIEVVQDNFSLADSVLKGDEGVWLASTLYFNDQNVAIDEDLDAFVSAIASYTVDGNVLTGSVSINNGVGTGLADTSFAITDNAFVLNDGVDPETVYYGNNGISITGEEADVNWRNAPSLAPDTVTGNTFAEGLDRILLEVDGIDARIEVDQAYVETLLAENDVARFAYVVDTNGTPENDADDSLDLDNGARVETSPADLGPIQPGERMVTNFGTFDAAPQGNTWIITDGDSLAATIEGAAAGDTILVGDGIYGPVSIDKSIALYAVNDGGAQIVGAGVNQGAAIRIEAGVSDVV